MISFCHIKNEIKNGITKGGTARKRPLFRVCEIWGAFFIHNFKEVIFMKHDISGIQNANRD